MHKAGLFFVFHCRGEDFSFGAVSHSVPHDTLKVSQSLLLAMFVER